MSRSIRIHFEGAWYHVSNCGIKGRNLFPDKAYYELFIDVVHQMCDIYQIECHAYCMLKNQYHLLLHTPQNNLSMAMRHLASVYAQHYNRVSDANGPLFRGRYEAMVIDANDYLPRVTRYIHQLPVDSGVVTVPEDYQWSSYQAYIGENNVPVWLCTRTTLDRFKDADARLQYKKYVNLRRDNELRHIYMKNRAIPVIGDATFRTNILENGSRQVDEKHECICNSLQRPNIEDIIRIATDYYSATTEDICMPDNRYAMHVRAVTMWLCRHVGGYSLKEIADSLQVTAYSTISTAVTRIKKSIRSESSLQCEVEHIKVLIKEYST